MDVHDKFTRSFNMSQIKSKGTKPEKIVRKLCWSLGLRYRLNKKILNTKPDLVFTKFKKVIYVHGCFWHSHNCKYGNVNPKTNSVFWEEKRLTTKKRDAKNINQLLSNGWEYLIIWECELKDIELVSKKLRSYFDVKEVSST